MGGQMNGSSNVTMKQSIIAIAVAVALAGNCFFASEPGTRTV